MKKRIGIILMMSCLFLITEKAFSQISFSTNQRTDALWSESEEEWIPFSKKQDATLFEFNEKMTMFTHTTTSITSTYFVKSDKFDDDKKRYDLEVVSDVGNKYLLVIDLENQNLRFFYDDDDNSYLIQHDIKKIWLDE